MPGPTPSEPGALSAHIVRTALHASSSMKGASRGPLLRSLVAIVEVVKVELPACVHLTAQDGGVVDGERGHLVVVCY